MVSRKRGAYQASTPETRSSKKLFVRTLPVLGKVPMMFYVPTGKKSKAIPEETQRVREAIESNGGKVVDSYEAYVYQICTSSALKHTSRAFYRGYVYKDDWIYDCIDEHKLIKDMDDYLCGFKKTSKLCTIPEGKRKLYTITEVLRLLELAEEDYGKKCPPMKFFHKLAAENMIPDRKANSLRTAWKKFSATKKPAFVRSALKKKGARYSHAFESVSELMCGENETEETKEDTLAKNMKNKFNETSPVSHLKLSDQPTPYSDQEMPQCDLEVMTKEPSIVNRDQESVEFVLEVEDMQSVVSNISVRDPSYSLRPIRKRRHIQTLDAMYDGYADRCGTKRVKVDEAEERSTLNEDESTIYNMEDLENFVVTRAKVKISTNITDGTRSVKSDLVAKTKEEGYFKEIAQQLEEL